MTLTELQTLYAYNRWANARLLGTAARLPPGELARELRLSHGSVLGTLRHILWAEWRWLDRWHERPPAGLDPLCCETLSALAARWADLETEQLAFLARLGPADLTRSISYDNPPGTRWTYALGQMLQHVVNHSSYHRGQVVSGLRQLGAEPPATDYLVYFDDLAAAPAP